MSQARGPRDPDALRPAWSQVPAALRRTAEPRRMLGQACVEWCWIVLAWALMLAVPSAVLGAVLVVLVGGRLHALGVVLHDACHMPGAPGSAGARRDARLRWLALLAGYPIATTIEAMRFHHLRHHRFSCLPTDPYLKLGVERPWRAFLMRARGVLIVPFWSLRSLVGCVVAWQARRGADAVSPRWFDAYRRIFLQDLGDCPSRVRAEVLACARADRGQALFLAAVLLVGWRWPAAALAGYWLPVTVAGVLNAHRVVAEHSHVLRPDDGVASLVQSTVTHDGGWWSRLVLYPRNIGYHQVHHLYPAASLDALPALDRWWRSRCGKRPLASVASASQKRPLSKPPPPTPGCEWSTSASSTCAAVGQIRSRVRKSPSCAMPGACLDIRACCASRLMLGCADQLATDIAGSVPTKPSSATARAPVAGSSISRHAASPPLARSASRHRRSGRRVPVSMSRSAGLGPRALWHSTIAASSGRRAMIDSSASRLSSPPRLWASTISGAPCDAHVSKCATSRRTLASIIPTGSPGAMSTRRPAARSARNADLK